ncbi:transmembrane sensor [Catalinimonas alkaloidigena]|uniref:FecR family protein n=1 Tax=Catalinimonas alkaloidigena TaxID=1075417 RepID=UPI0024055F6A|nr:FecR domain-containing protein [Catalinimonas alkaloidigena]MDF9799486.1 transmembrane sensor [Catalinimonas alkaloidigena]
MNYEYFHVNDFVTDHFFQRWVRSPDELTNTFWEQWLRDHPAKRNIIQEARVIVKSVEIEEAQYSEDDFQEVKSSIKAELFEGYSQQSSKKNITLNLSSRFRWLKSAAVVSGLIILSIFLLQQWLPTAEYSTGYGKQRKVVLPDGSQVLLNANTTLKIAADWDENREVWLDGEAYFEVEKKMDTSPKAELCKFIVHAQEIDIEVLGTSFNVLDRRNLTLVVLEEGVVELKKKEVEEERLRMQAGELVSYSKQNQSFKRKKANIRVDLSWKNGKHTYEATPLKVIGKKIEDDYGLTVKFESEELGERRFSASVPFGELDVLLNLIAKSMQVDITNKDGVITISKKH